MTNEENAIADVCERGFESALDFCLALWDVPQHNQRKDDGKERDCVDEIDHLLTQIADDNPAQRGTDDCSCIKGNGLQLERARQNIARHKILNQRLSRRKIERHGNRLDCRQRVDVPELDFVEKRQQTKSNRYQQRSGLCEEENNAAIVTIRHETTNQREA